MMVSQSVPFIIVICDTVFGTWEHTQFKNRLINRKFRKIQTHKNEYVFTICTFFLTERLEKAALCTTTSISNQKGKK